VFEDLRFETLICDSPRPRIARLTLNRPQAMNAYTFAMCEELQRAIAAFRDDDDLIALILTGAGNRAFCTGGDIGGSDEANRARIAAAPMGRGRAMRDGMQAVVLALTQLDKPSVAMIRGYAVAGGLALALACDFRFAADTARLGDTSNKVGLLPDEGGAWLFPRAMGLDRALKMTLLHEIYDAGTALNLGLVTEIVAEADLEARTLDFCAALAAKAPLAMRLTKMMMARSGDVTLAQSMIDAQLAVHIANPSADVFEGVAAFREKRKPKFSGRQLASPKVMRRALLVQAARCMQRGGCSDHPDRHRHHHQVFGQRNKAQRHIAAAADTGAFQLALVDVNGLEDGDSADAADNQRDRHRQPRQCSGDHQNTGSRFGE